MDEAEFAAWLRERRGAVTHADCLAIDERVLRAGLKRDAETGPWVGNEIVHHEYGESRG